LSAARALANPRRFAKPLSDATLFAIVLFAVLALGSLPSVAAAQTSLPRPGFNWAYLSGIGGADGLSDNRLDDNGQKLQVLRLTPGFWLRSTGEGEQRRWGLRLLLPTTLGVNERTFLDGAVQDSLRAFSLVPTLEAHVPAGRLVTVKPRLGFGWGHNITDGDDALVMESGLKVDIEPRSGDWYFLIRPELRYDLARTQSTLGDDDIGAAYITLDVLRPLPLTMGGSVPDVSVYGQYGYFFEEALLPRPNAPPRSIVRQYEVGLTIGSDPMPRIWFIRMSRLQIGYRWGEGLSGLRIRIGSR